MDTSRFKRRETQTRRHTEQKQIEGIGNSARSLPTRPQNFQPLPLRPVSAPLLLNRPPVTVTALPTRPPATFRQAIPAPRLMTQVAPTSDSAQVAPSVVAAPQPPTQVVTPLLPTAPFNMDLGDAPAPARSLGPIQRLHLPRPLHSLRFLGRLVPRSRWAVRGAAVVVIVVVALGGLLFSQAFTKVHKVFTGTTGTAAALKATVSPDLLSGEGAGRINVLIMGRTAADLTNSMMIASIDPINHSSVLVSIPSNLWVQVAGANSMMEINAAWETGASTYLGASATGTTNSSAIEAGYKTVDQAIQTVTGMTVNYNMLVNFQGFQQAVDTVDGVTVDVPADLNDPAFAAADGGSPLIASAGSDLLTGAEALAYARSESTTSDFDRAQRQESVLQALKEKVDTLGVLDDPTKVADLFNEFTNNVTTDLSISDASRLYDIVKQINSASVSTLNFNDTSNSYVTDQVISGLGVVVPKAGLTNYNAIQEYLRSQIKDSYLLAENARVLVLNGTTLPGLATDQSTILKGYGYNVINVGDAPTTGWTTTTIVDLAKGKDSYTEHYLKERYSGASFVTSLPDSFSANDSLITTNRPDFVIIVGSDETANQ